MPIDDDRSALTHPASKTPRLPILDHPVEAQDLMGDLSPIRFDSPSTRALTSMDPAGESVLPASLAGLAAVLSRYDSEREMWMSVRGVGTHPVLETEEPGAPALLYRVEVDEGASLSEMASRYARLLEEGGAPCPPSHEVDPAQPTLPHPTVLVEFDTLAGVPDDDQLMVRIASTADGLWVDVEYGNGPEAPGRAGWIAGHLRTLLANGIQRPDAPLSSLGMVSDEERGSLLGIFSGVRTDYPRTATVPELFEEVVDRFPDALALDDGNLQLTYRDLDIRANRLARYLRGRGVARGERVGLCMERTPAMVTAVLAVAKAGAAYVPLDPSYPTDRLSLLMADTCIRLVLTQRSLAHLVSQAAGEAVAGSSEVEGDGINVVALDTVDEALAKEDAGRLAAGSEALDPIYVMYTSGSTGTPKGVEIPHRAVVRLVRGTNYVRLDSDECMLCYAPLSFDASTFEIWGALLNGARLAVMPPGLASLAQLGHFIAERAVTTVWLTAPLFHRMVDRYPQGLQGVRQLLAGGDVLSPRHVHKVLAEVPGCRVINGYGPTENTTFTCCHVVTSSEDVGEAVPIGRPIANTRVYILNPKLEPVPVGVPGELFAGGDGVGLGYLGLPDLTSERFLPDPFSTSPEVRLYRTGDRARFLGDGRIEFLGRLDHQMKVRGFRVEPGEVEVALARHEAVGECVVVGVVRDGETEMVAYVSPSPNETILPSELRRFLRQTLPEYMVPSVIVLMDRLPINPNGKVDRAALPNPLEERPAESAPAAQPSSEWETRLTELWTKLLATEGIGIDDGFFDVGGNSLVALQMVEDLRNDHGVSLPLAKIFQHPTIRTLSAHLSGAGGDHTAAQLAHARIRGLKQTRGTSSDLEGIAVVGMAGRFPGASSVDELWTLLCDGRETTTFFLETPEGLDPSIPPEERGHPDYVPARGIIEGADRLDAPLLGVNPRLAQVTDPQHRVFLEAAWEALESAGYPPGTPDELIGVYAGMGYNSYFPRNVAPHRELVHSLGDLRVQLANEKDYVAIATAHKLDLRGPAVSIHTACSTSLTAVAHACQALLMGQCDMALAGGVAVTVPQRSGHIYQEGGMLSADGHCRPFDAHATGTVFSDGVAVVVLKRLSDAERDQNTIYAVIRGIGINNDGAEKASFTAPTVNGQAAAISMAIAQAGWDADTVTFVEAHGTATPLGDPVEVEGLTQAFRVSTDRTGFCALGSLKSNMGHLTAAAGAAGLIKAALAVHHGVIPGTLHYESPNPAIEFGNSPFYVNAQTMEWPRSPVPRRAGVSSFGVGGTNVHVVLEEYRDTRAPTSDAIPQVLLLSARSRSALDAATDRLQARLARSSDVAVPDVAFTLQIGRRRFKHRRFVVAGDTVQASERLRDLPASHVVTGEAPERGTGPVFVFPGQGVQYPGMCRDLYARDPAFRADLDRCAEVLGEKAGLDLLGLIFAQNDSPDASTALAQTSVTQPALFSVEYALARLWLRWGVEPRAMVGHSLGEITAACVAGVLTLDDALELVAARGQLIQALPAGSMLSVQAPASWVMERLPGNVSLAAENAPGLVAVSGPTPDISALEQAWAAEGIRCRALKTSHAFHSAMMDAALEPFRKVVQGLRLFPPEIPVMSAVTGSWLTPEEAVDPEYWVRHIRATVRFGPAVTALGEEGYGVFLEIGPRASASTLVGQCLGSSAVCVPTMEVGPKDDSEWDAVLRAVGRLWIQGFELDWGAFHRDADLRRIDLPTYPFEGKSYWIEPPEPQPTHDVAELGGASLTGVGAAAGAPAPWDQDLVRRQLGIIRSQLELMGRSLPTWRGSSSGGTVDTGLELPTRADS